MTQSLELCSSDLIASVFFLSLSLSLFFFFELFYLEQNEEYSPGDSISNSSEKLLQKGRGGKVSMYMIFFFLV